MERLYPIKLSQLCIPILFILVGYIPYTLSEEIGVNCGSGAVVGQKYDMECTNIPRTVENGINVFLGDEVNSIIACISTNKKCFSQYPLLYSVVSPHNESLFFTILNVTTDDIGKKLYCVDDPKLDTAKQSCTLALVQTTEGTTTSKEVTDNGIGLSGGAIAGIVIAVIVVVLVIIIVCICTKCCKECCLCWKKCCKK